MTALTLAITAGLSLLTVEIAALVAMGKSRSCYRPRHSKPRADR